MRREAPKGISLTELAPENVASGSLDERGANSDALRLLFDQ